MSNEERSASAEQGQCCAAAPALSASCPVCRDRGLPVVGVTVAALVLGPVPTRQAFWLCRNRACEIAYFGDAGTLLQTSELRFVPAFKSESPEALVCYCFLHRRKEIESELQHEGASTLVDRIAAKVKARECACEVRNPSGRCCLGEVKTEADRLRTALLRVG